MDAELQRKLVPAWAVASFSWFSLGIGTHDPVTHDMLSHPEAAAAAAKPAQWAGSIGSDKPKPYG